MSTPLNNPNGFTPHQPVLRVTRYWKGTAAGIIGRGDAVVRVTGSTNPDGGMEIVKHTVGSYVTGVVVDVAPVGNDLNRQGYLSATETGYVYVADHPLQKFDCMEAGSGTALADTNTGKHINSITAANANTTIGRSVDAIDNNALATNNTWIIMERQKLPDNDPSGVGTRWVVQANLHTEVNAGVTNVKEI